MILVEFPNKQIFQEFLDEAEYIYFQYSLFEGKFNKRIYMVLYKPYDINIMGLKK